MSDLPAIVLNDILLCNIAQWQIIIMYITYGKVLGGTPKIFMFWLFLKMEAFRSELLTRH